MSTFYGGEQISQVVSVSGSTTTVAGRVLILYTVPVGFYGVLKWFYMGRNDANYLSGGNSFSGSWVVSASQDLSYNLIQNEGFNLCSNTIIWREQKERFQVDTLRNVYLAPGDRIVNLEQVSNQPVKWEGELHLFKKP